MSDGQTTQIQDCLDRLRSGDRAARDALLGRTFTRLEQLTRVMLRDYARVRRWYETGDVLQGALLRLSRALEELTPVSPRDFFRLVALQVRRELIDLARHQFHPNGPGARHSTVHPGSHSPSPEKAESTDEPSRLASWTELHEAIAGLPEEDREIFDLLWYQDLSQPEAAGVLGLSERTLKRRWQAARLRLQRALGGELPG